MVPQQATQQNHLVQQRTEVSFSGPLPPPQTLVHYNDAFPGCAERIVAMAERQSEHRQELERTHLRAGVFNERLGMVLAFVLALFVCGSDVWLLSTGHQIEGLAALIVPVATLVGVFVYGKKKTTEERDRKLRQIPTTPPSQQR